MQELPLSRDHLLPPIRFLTRPGTLTATLIVFVALFAIRETNIVVAQEGKNPHGSFKEECSLCHSPESWVPATVGKDFDHSKYGLTLIGAHTQTPCASCHQSLDFSATSEMCVECHQDIHQGELGVDCESCHTTRSFIDRSTMERAHQLTRFPLAGVHATLDCEVCHAGPETGNLVFVNQSGECQACHLNESLTVNQPDHTGGAFSEDCSICHGTLAWDMADFDHAGTRFPLTGAHVRLDCALCHGNGAIEKVDSECVACHQQDYDNTTEPVHSGAGFPLDCATCHTTGGWTGAFFEHTSFFPIFSGAHQGKWDDCQTCHFNPSSYTEFTCFQCHPHSDQQKTAEGHSEVVDYVYESLACYTCHPTGKD